MDNVKEEIEKVYKLEETPKDRFETVWNTNTFNGDAETDSDEIWNYHTTELKAVLKRIKEALELHRLHMIRIKDIEDEVDKILKEV